MFTVAKVDRKFVYGLGAVLVVGLIVFVKTQMAWQGDPNRPDCLAWGIRRITTDPEDKGKLSAFKYKIKQDAEEAADFLTAKDLENGKGKYGYVVECVEWPGGGQ